VERIILTFSKIGVALLCLKFCDTAVRRRLMVCKVYTNFKIPLREMVENVILF